MSGTVSRTLKRRNKQKHHKRRGGAKSLRGVKSLISKLNPFRNTTRRLKYVSIRNPFGHEDTYEKIERKRVDKLPQEERDRYYKEAFDKNQRAAEAIKLKYNIRDAIDDEEQWKQ